MTAFRPLTDAAQSVDDLVEILVDDVPIRARRGQNLAALLLSEGVTPFRNSPVTREPRAPFCMMGTCFECLVEIDGLSNCQACLTKVREGMRIRRQL